VPAPAHYDALRVFGPFKRRMSTTQSPQDMRAIVASGQLWGRVPFGSGQPAVQALRGPLLAGDVGFEFFAEQPPEHLYGDPRWYVRADGSVWLDEDLAKMRIFLSRVTMPLT
jgi:hypothetical protein